MLILLQHAAEAVPSVDGQVDEPVWIGDRFGPRCKWPEVRDALMRTVLVVEDLELATCVPQMALAPDQCAVQQRCRVLEPLVVLALAEQARAQVPTREGAARSQYCSSW
jgi:hypothetical protein